MIQEESELIVADNTGAKRVRCIRVLGGTRRRYAGVGDIIVGSVKKADPHGNVKKGEVVRVVVVTTKQTRRRNQEGVYHNYTANRCVLLDPKNQPRGSRVFGPVDRRVKEMGFTKVAFLAPEVI